MYLNIGLSNSITINWNRLFRVVGNCFLGRMLEQLDENNGRAIENCVDSRGFLHNPPSLSAL